MAKSKFRFHLDPKAAIAAALIVFLPIVVIVASSPKLNQTSSNAYVNNLDNRPSSYLWLTIKDSGDTTIFNWGVHPNPKFSPADVDSYDLRGYYLDSATKKYHEVMQRSTKATSFSVDSDRIIKQSGQYKFQITAYAGKFLQAGSKIYTTSVIVTR